MKRISFNRRFVNVAGNDLVHGKIEQVNIVADSGNNGLPEPPKEKLLEFISELEKFTKVHLKKNLVRLIK